MRTTQEQFLASVGAIELPRKKTGIVIPSTLNTYEDKYLNTGETRTKTITRANKALLSPFVENIKSLFAQFGGYTAQEQFGGWLDNGAIVEEKSLYVWAYCNPAIEELTTLVLIAQSLKAELHQDAILIVVNDTPYLI